MLYYIILYFYIILYLVSWTVAGCGVYVGSGPLSVLGRPSRWGAWDSQQWGCWTWRWNNTHLGYDASNEALTTRSVVVLIIWYHVILYRMIWYCHILCYMILAYAIICFAMLCYAMLCYAMYHHAMLLLCYAMTCYIILWYSTLCHITSYHISISHRATSLIEPRPPGCTGREQAQGSMT